MTFSTSNIISTERMIFILLWQLFSSCQFLNNFFHQFGIISSFNNPFIIFFKRCVISNLQHLNPPSALPQKKKNGLHFFHVSHHQ